MGTAIAYDKPVKNLIDGLSRTGHVTHTKHRKTSVTIHHNAGRLTLDSILKVWESRPASAHFQVDAAGAVGQYVEINEYAWATGSTAGNQSSISIEMANRTLGPEWAVAEVTWQEAARLAGWIFARVIGQRPSADNLFQHKHWKSTTCAGPYVDKIFGQLIELAGKHYDAFVSGGASPSPAPAPAPTGATKSVAQLADEVIRGLWGSGDERKRRLGSQYAAVQAEVNRKLSGGGSAPAPQGKSVSELADEVMRGDWGNGPTRAARLHNAGFDAGAVQAEVNRRAGIPSGQAPQPTRLSLSALATQVIQGQWGNGTERKTRLANSGYDADAVQAEVNRQLRRR